MLKPGYLLIICFSLLSFYTQQAWSTASTPQRIISLAPHITEMLFSAGAGHKIVGVVDYSDFPEAALAIDSVGSYHALNIEKIIQLNPDLIIAWNKGNRPKDLEKLQQLGFKVHYSEPYQLMDIPKEIRAFGDLLNTDNTANPLASQLELTLNTLAESYQSKSKVSAFYQIWNKPMMTINGDQFISQAMQICGATNVFAELPLLAAEVSIESVIQKNPDMILLGGEKSMQQAWLKDWQKWQTLNAVKNGYIRLLKADTFQRPTARFIMGIESLCKQVDQVRQTR